MSCEHNYQYKGLEYYSGDTHLPGSGAKHRYYEDVYFCTKCLDEQAKNRRIIGHDYLTPIAGSTPSRNPKTVLV